MSIQDDLLAFGIKNLSGLAGLPGYATGPLTALTTGIARGDSGSRLQNNVINSLGKTAIGGLLGATGLPSYATGPLGALATGLLSGASPADMRESVGNQLISSALGYAIPGAGPVIGILNMLGFNPMQGLGDTFGGYQGAPGYQGSLGGYFGKNSTGSGISGSIYGGNTGVPGLRQDSGIPVLGKSSDESGLGLRGNGISLSGLPSAGQFTGMRYGDYQAPAPVVDKSTAYRDYTASDSSGPSHSYSYNSPTNGTVGTNNTYSGSGEGNSAGPGSNYGPSRTTSSSSDSDSGSDD